MKVYLVGGAVRDRLLGRCVRERDWVVVGATAQEMERAGYRVKDPDFPVYLHPETGDEYALARRESKTGSGYKGFHFDISPNITLADDLARRDLTINAMAQSESGKLIDPYNGRIDLQARCLRHITPAFVEDPLRLLRLARFHAQLCEFQFSIAQQTESLAIQISRSNELHTLSAPRIWREASRALSSNAPAAFFQTLHRWQALTQLMPWIADDNSRDISEPMSVVTRAGERCTTLDVRTASLLLSIARSRISALELSRAWPISALSKTLFQLCIDYPPPQRPTAEDVFDWLEAVDAWRRTERFDALLDVWRAVTPESETSLNQLRQCCDCSRRIPPAIITVNPREAVRAYRLAQIAKRLQ